MSVKRRIVSHLHYFLFNDLGTKVCFRVFPTSFFRQCIQYQTFSVFLDIVPFASLKLCCVESSLCNLINSLLSTAIFGFTSSDVESPRSCACALVVVAATTSTLDSNHLASWLAKHFG